MAKAASKPRYENWPRQTLKVSDLFLDPENIRLQVEVKSPQQSLINDLFINENAMQVLESIANNGFFPDEVPVVVKENGKVFTIEGNRRVAALKALARPELVPSKEPEIKELAKVARPIIDELEVVVAPDRASVRHFLASKHTQSTRRPWRPLRQAYFYKAELERGKTVENLRTEYPGVDIEKFLRLINIHKIAKSLTYDSDQVAKRVRNERRFPATTIERLYEDKQVRNFLGFDFDKDGEVKIGIDRKEFEKGFKKVLQDVTGGFASGFGTVDSRTLNDEKQRSKYLASFPKSEIPNRAKGSRTFTSKDFKEREPAKSKARTRLAPHDIPYGLKSAGVRRMLSELQEIDYRKFPNASHDLLRSFLECSLKAYFEQHGKTVKTTRTGGYVFLDDVLNEFINEMKTAKHHRLQQVASRIKGNANMTSYSTLFLNATNHNPDVFATPEEVAQAWDAMEPLFRHIFQLPEKKNAQNKP
jgi:hypothetical protein